MLLAAAMSVHVRYACEHCVIHLIFIEFEKYRLHQNRWRWAAQAATDTPHNAAANTHSHADTNKQTKKWDELSFVCVMCLNVSECVCVRANTITVQAPRFLSCTKYVQILHDARSEIWIIFFDWIRCASECRRRSFARSRHMQLSGNNALHLDRHVAFSRNSIKYSIRLRHYFFFFVLPFFFCSIFFCRSLLCHHYYMIVTPWPMRERRGYEQKPRKAAVKAMIIYCHASC